MKEHIIESKKLERTDTGCKKRNLVVLQVKLLKNSFIYRQLFRSRDIAVYEQIDPDSDFKVIAYEVFRILIQPARKFNGKEFPRKERFPSNEDFGKTAWSYRSLTIAMRKYKELQDSTSSNIEA